LLIATNPLLFIDKPLLSCNDLILLLYQFLLDGKQKQSKKNKKQTTIIKEKKKKNKKIKGLSEVRTRVYRFLSF
jgi:hypothetical protein